MCGAKQKLHIPVRQRERFRANIAAFPRASQTHQLIPQQHIHACPPASFSVEAVGWWLWMIPRDRLNTPPERLDKQRIGVPLLSTKKSGSSAPQPDSSRGITSDKPWGFFPQVLRATWGSARYHYFSFRRRLLLGAAKGGVFPTKN